jgi:hypothetical protein
MLLFFLTLLLLQVAFHPLLQYMCDVWDGSKVTIPLLGTCQLLPATDCACVF